MYSNASSLQTIAVAASTEGATDVNTPELNCTAELDLRDLSLEPSSQSIDRAISRPRVMTPPVGWSLQSSIPENFPMFSRLPFELRSMIWVHHHHETNEIVINFKKTVYRAKSNDVPINNVNTKGVTIKRMWRNKVRAYTPEENTTGLLICKESATAYKRAKPCIFKYRLTGAKIHFNQRQDVILFSAEHCYFTYLYAQAIRPPGGFAGGFIGLENIKRVLFTSSALVFDIDRVIDHYKAECAKAEEGREDAMRYDPSYERYMKEAQDYEIVQIKKGQKNAQYFIEKFVLVLVKNNIQIWQEGEENEVFLAQV
ncbi:hypothetical protein ONS95_008469 [Cadophora gregata]|uniref:uncharacterized protein n=1 Tax=Cadophora gregata TaxID=51156 RepID=UPI0026DB8436|nr:uncharacterized protein ONS95_008469 [Cadophora gregata]KAK0100130.1 hypothetical protein ONS95_008469 [Cadophora gregata]